MCHHQFCKLGVPLYLCFCIHHSPRIGGFFLRVTSALRPCSYFPSMLFLLFWAFLLFRSLSSVTLFFVSSALLVTLLFWLLCSSVYSAPPFTLFLHSLCSSIHSFIHFRALCSSVHYSPSLCSFVHSALPFTLCSFCSFVHACSCLVGASFLLLLT